MITSSSLTARERVFTEQFAAHGNAVAAAQAAGWPTEQAELVAQTMLDQPHIKQQLHVLALLNGMSEPEATLRLTQLGRASVAPFLRVDADGQAHLDLSTDQARANFHLLRRVVQRRTITQTSAGPEEMVETEIELHDAIGAVDKLLQLHGAYPTFLGEVCSSGGPGTNIYLPDNGRGDMYQTSPMPAPELPQRIPTLEHAPETDPE